jgi:hypothetical protein
VGFKDQLLRKNMLGYFFFFLPKRLRKGRTNGKTFSMKRCILEGFFLGLSKYSVP